MGERGAYLRKAPERNVDVVLICGCTIKVRLDPLNKGAKYSCTSGLQHGYQLSWVKAKSANGRWKVNDSH